MHFEYNPFFFLFSFSCQASHPVSPFFLLPSFFFSICSLVFWWSKHPSSLFFFFRSVSSRRMRLAGQSFQLSSLRVYFFDGPTAISRCTPSFFVFSLVLLPPRWRSRLSPDRSFSDYCLSPSILSGLSPVLSTFHKRMAFSRSSPRNVISLLTSLRFRRSFLLTTFC